MRARRREGPGAEKLDEKLGEISGAVTEVGEESEDDEDLE